MFYYLLHIPLIHVLALATMRLGGGSGMSQWYATAPYTQVPESQRWSLLTLYGVFVLAVALTIVLNFSRCIRSTMSASYSRDPDSFSS